MTDLVVLYDLLEDVDERLEELSGVGPAGPVEAGAEAELGGEHRPAHAVGRQELHLPDNSITWPTSA